MKILVTGVKGQLGYDLIRELNNRDISNVGIDKDNADITDENKIKDIIITTHPDAVIHCAAYTQVDNAEDNRELCRKINVDGTRYIADACAETGSKMIYISTDYIFDGQGSESFKTTSTPKPVNWYGQTKYEGELAVQKALNKYFIVRTSWVFGLNGGNFVKTMLRLGREKGKLSVVSDQTGSPTYTLDLARLLIEMLSTDSFGIYHASNKGFCSWYDFAVEIFKQAGLNVTVIPVTSEQYATKAKRPQNSQLDTSLTDALGKAFVMPSWQSALSDYIRVLKENKYEFI